MKRSQMALVAFVAVLALAVTVAAEAQPPAGGKPLGTLNAELARAANQKDAVINSVLRSLGPVLKAQLAAGRQVEVPGVGIFRIVRIEAHRDLIGGIPGIVPAKNYVDFVASTDLNAAATLPGAIPARTIPGYEFRVNPTSAPSSRIEGLRTPRGRASRIGGVGD